jgi:pimeloyl-ACP methyl ester carboxylesterase
MQFSHIKHRFLIILVLLLIALIGLSCQGQSGSPSTGTAISVDGVTIRYYQAGAGTPALVFVHGWCADRSYWIAQMPHFTERYQVVTLDLAGHGESGLDREDWTMAAFGQDVAAVVDELDLAQVVLIGHSMGGPVVMEAARLMPDRVIGLVGVDNFHNMDETYSKGQFEEFLRPMRANFVEATDGFVRAMFPPSADSALVEQIAADISSAPRGVGIAAMEGFFLWFQADFPGVSQGIMAPLHCINSDVYPTQVETNRRYFPSFRVSVMSGVGHFAHMEDPVTFNRLLEEAVEAFRR